MRADGRNLSLVFGSVEVACVSTSVILDNDDAPAEVVTFADITTGNDKRWAFTISGYPDYAAGSFWSVLWDAELFTGYPYLFRPYGNADPTPDQPHFAGQIVVDRRPPLGGDAGRAWTFEARLRCTAPPTRITATEAAA